MTAQRWWVQVFARWQARIDSVKGQIQAISLLVTAYSTFSLLLQNSGHGEYVMPMGIILAISGPVYAYLYFEGGVWNQVNRDRADMSGDYAAPGGTINSILTAAALAPVITGEPLDKDSFEEMKESATFGFEQLREGILDDVED